MPPLRNYRLTLYSTTMKLSNDIFYKEVENMLRSGETVKIKLGGDSMLPFLRGGKDSVILSPFKKEELKHGSRALFKYKGGYVLHRIVSIDDDVYTFRGDGNVGLTEMVLLNDIVALMTSVERPSGRISYCSSRRCRAISCLWMLLLPFRRYLLWFYYII